MNLHSLKTDEEYKELLNWIDVQFDGAVSQQSETGKDLKIALLLVKQYEDLYFPIPKT